MQNHRVVLSLVIAVFAITVVVPAAEPDAAYHHDGPLAGSLKSAEPLRIYDDDPEHLWNRLFAAFYIRPSALPDDAGGPPVPRIEGGDTIDFLAWAGTTYWDEPDVSDRLHGVVDEFLESDGVNLIEDPLRRVILLRDLWAVFDWFTDQNIRRIGSIEIRGRRSELCGKLARIISSLALTGAELAELPDNYDAALASGEFATGRRLDPRHNYLPAGLLTQPDEWVEIDFYEPDLHEDLFKRRITLHTRSYRARSYFRIFYRFPDGRARLTDYLANLETTGIDWKQAAQDGFINLTPEAAQIPIGTEFALVQFMMTLDEQLYPTPTGIIESVRLRNYLSTDGSEVGDTNTNLGMNIMEYTLKRRLLFAGVAGGLAREPDEGPIYRVIFQGDRDPDWGHDRRKVLFQQCVDCHMSPNANRTGVQSVPSIVHMGGFGAGAQLGISVPLEADDADVRGRRAARWKIQHETYRRLLEHLER